MALLQKPMELISLLMGTVALRPYVFVFFALYLFIAITSIGAKRTAIFTLTAFLTAFACEYSSTHLALGVPFGVYHYIETTRGRELWIAGVPFMDSLSFTFLSFISYRTAVFLLGPLTNWHAGKGRQGVARPMRPLSIAVLGGFLMMYLDIIIDPLTLQGKRWFLGEIYLYPEHGLYFGVTLANFIGWFIVGLVIVLLFQAVERRMDGVQGALGLWRYRFQDFSPVVLYFAVLAFNLFITFYIRETSMGLAGVFITLPLLLLVVFSAMLYRAGAALPASADRSTQGLPADDTSVDIGLQAG